MADLETRLRSAWQGRNSGCPLGEAVEALLGLRGYAALQTYLDAAGALPLRDYVPLVEDCPGDDGAAAIRRRYAFPPVHTLNNLALVVWALLANPDDFGAAIGDVVAAGCDTDCNGATVGGLWGLQGKPIPETWLRPWRGRVGVSLAGFDELDVDELVDRTAAVARSLGSSTAW